MQEGLLWFDNNPQHKLADKISQAAARYQDRLQHRPTVCYLNANEFDKNVEIVDGILIKPSPRVLPHHLWIGVEADGFKTA